MFLQTSKPCQKQLPNFPLQNQENKNDQVMENSELKLKIHFRVFSCHNMPEVE